jgi:hypothetical protein
VTTSDTGADTGDDYRRLARQAREAAARTIDTQSRTAYEQLAARFIRLAEEADQRRPRTAPRRRPTGAERNP